MRTVVPAAHGRERKKQGVECGMRGVVEGGTAKYQWENINEIKLD